MGEYDLFYLLKYIKELKFIFTGIGRGFFPAGTGRGWGGDFSPRGRGGDGEGIFLRGDGEGIGRGFSLAGRGRRFFFIPVTGMGIDIPYGDGDGD